MFLFSKISIFGRGFFFQRLHLHQLSLKSGPNIGKGWWEELAQPLTCAHTHRWPGDLRPGHLRHDAVHPEPHLHVVCGPGRQHGLPASRCGHPRHATLAPQFTHHDPPALWGRPGECQACKLLQGWGTGLEGRTAWVKLLWGCHWFKM